jgi:UDP-N-acetylglucosamine 4,6-dehydratase
MNAFKDKTLMIIGGTGSFGNAVVEKFIQSGLNEIRIFSRDEKKQNDMRIKLNSGKLKFYIGDVRDYTSVKDALTGVDLVFHAAALKQVPSCEFFPIEATKTNVLGTDNVIRAAIEQKVKSLVCLSTDKAAYPINSMGMSKALMEKVVVAASRNVDENHTKLCLTRYGNVMASRGSVIPLFVDQMKKKQNLTITDPSMTRFLMSLEEAVDLVLYAFENGNQGDLFVQKAPASTILDIAIALKEIFKSDSKIEVIGKRHGEKLYETLCTREEMQRATDLGKYLQIPADTRDLNYSKYFEVGNLNPSSSTDYNSENTTQLNTEEIKSKLLELDYIKQELELWQN